MVLKTFFLDIDEGFYLPRLGVFYGCLDLLRCYQGKEVVHNPYIGIDRPFCTVIVQASTRELSKKN